MNRTMCTFVPSLNSCVVKSKLDFSRSVVSS